MKAYGGMELRPRTFLILVVDIGHREGAAVLNPGSL